MHFFRGLKPGLPVGLGVKGGKFLKLLGGVEDVSCEGIVGMAVAHSITECGRDSRCMR